MASESQIPQRPSPVGEKPVPFPQFDGATDEPPPPAPAPFTQISLTGSTLKQAWAENEEVRKIATFETLPLQHWTPATPGGALVFRGTSNHQKNATLEMEYDVELSRNPTRVQRRPGKTQLFPLSQDISGIYTSFSALGSFLWSVFEADVIRDPPDPSATTVFDKTFQMRGNPYKGVILMEFNPSQPTPQGLSWYQVPVGKEWDWQRASSRFVPSDFDNPGGPGVWQSCFGSIHRLGTQGFPDILHGRDQNVLRQSLHQFPCKQALLWQSAWMSEGAALALNRRISAIYSISFEKVEPATPQTTPGKKKTFGTLGRSLGRGFKKMAGKGCGKQ